MSKAMLALLLLASVALYDPPRVFGLFGPQAQAFGWTVKSWVMSIPFVSQILRSDKR